MQLLQCTASLPWCSRQCNSYNALPHYRGALGSGTPAIKCLCLGAVGSANPVMHRLIAWGQWAVGLQHTASLTARSGLWNSCNKVAHCLRVVGGATPALHCLTALGSGQCNSCNTLGSGTLATHCLTAWGQWAVEVLQYTAPLPGWHRVGYLANRVPPLTGSGSAQISSNHSVTDSSPVQT